MVEKVISGGQTGIDRMGLEVAKAMGIPTGGTAPKGYKTENGPDLTLRDEFGLQESWSSSYNPRTLKNIQDADATVIFGNTSSPGSKLTISYSAEEGRPYISNPTQQQLEEFLEKHDVTTLNVAGNRGSKIDKHFIDQSRVLLLEALFNNRS